MFFQRAKWENLSKNTVQIAKVLFRCEEMVLLSVLSLVTADFNSVVWHGSCLCSNSHIPISTLVSTVLRLPALCSCCPLALECLPQLLELRAKPQPFLRTHHHFKTFSVPLPNLLSQQTFHFCSGFAMVNSAISPLTYLSDQSSRNPCLISRV